MGLQVGRFEIGQVQAVVIPVETVLVVMIEKISRNGNLLRTLSNQRRNFEAHHSVK